MDYEPICISTMDFKFRTYVPYLRSMSYSIALLPQINAQYAGPMSRIMSLFKA